MGKCVLKLSVEKLVSSRIAARSEISYLNLENKGKSIGNNENMWEGNQN